jgi:hypothetical protein
VSEEELQLEEEASQVVIVERGEGLHDPGGWLAEEIEVRVLLEISHW